MKTQEALVLYGIRNCETVKKARAWLDARGIEYRFHDYKAGGAEAAVIGAWCRELGWEAVLNRSGTTFRKLQPGLAAPLDEDSAIVLMVANPSAIRRPIVAGRGLLLAGFKPEAYAAAFA